MSIRRDPNPGRPNLARPNRGRHPERSRFSGGAKSLPRADTRGDLARIANAIECKLIPESLP